MFIPWCYVQPTLFWNIELLWAQFKGKLWSLFPMREPELFASHFSWKYLCKAVSKHCKPVTRVQFKTKRQLCFSRYWLHVRVCGNARQLLRWVLHCNLLLVKCFLHATSFYGLNTTERVLHNKINNRNKIKTQNYTTKCVYDFPLKFINAKLYTTILPLTAATEDCIFQPAWHKCSSHSPTHKRVQCLSWCWNITFVERVYLHTNRLCWPSKLRTFIMCSARKCCMQQLFLKWFENDHSKL